VRDEPATVDLNSGASAEGSVSLLDAGQLPVEELALLAEREGWRPRPIYQAHRWFARRFGSAFRGLLTSAAIPSDGDFWRSYYDGADWTGLTILDPFVGGGTSAVEAQRLGANVIGVDIDAVACAISRFELRAAAVPDLTPTLALLQRQVGDRLSRFYQTVTPDGRRLDVLHYFWVQVLPCRQCGEWLEAHPHYQLAYEAEGTHQWVFCPTCHSIEHLPRTQSVMTCASCGHAFEIQQGPVKLGKITCKRCQTAERLIDVAARRGETPLWKLFALETIEPRSPNSGTRSIPLAARTFCQATDYDQVLFDEARQALETRRGADGSIPWVPDRCIPREGRSDQRLPAYGYERYAQLFNPRQLLHLSYLAEEIAALDGPEREALSLAFSDHLATNCMMTAYAFGWRRLAPLFSLRAYRHVPRPVEINPWLNGTGRGTFPNAVRQVQRAIYAARAPKEPTLDGGFHVSAPVTSEEAQNANRCVIWQRNAKDLSIIPSASVDFVLTDPPYFDNIAYAELSDFYLPWLQMLGLAAADDHSVSRLQGNLAATRRDQEAVREFACELTACFREIARVLKPTARLVFTYQHKAPGAWVALAAALAQAGLRPIQLFPLRGDHRAGLHAHQGSSHWDAVFVAINHQPSRDLQDLRLSHSTLAASLAHAQAWSDRLATAEPCRFSDADRCNFTRASLVAGALGMFPGTQNQADDDPLDRLLERLPLDTVKLDRRL
jgi:SAM-dependent methyltransferase